MNEREDFQRTDSQLVAEARESPAPPTSKQPNDMPPEIHNRRYGGIPYNRRLSTFESFELLKAPAMKLAVQRCRAVAERRAWCAFLYGEPGTGKTHLAIAALLVHVKRGEGGAFWKVSDYLAWLRGKFRSETGADEIEEILRLHGESDALMVLDDYGAHNATDWAEEQLYRVLDRRYEAQVPTIITSNMPLDTLDARIRSRYREGLVVCKAKDWRARKPPEEA